MKHLQFSTTTSCNTHLEIDVGAADGAGDLEAGGHGQERRRRRHRRHHRRRRHCGNDHLRSLSQKQHSLSCDSSNIVIIVTTTRQSVDTCRLRETLGPILWGALCHPCNLRQIDAEAILASFSIFSTFFSFPFSRRPKFEGSVGYILYELRFVQISTGWPWWSATTFC